MKKCSHCGKEFPDEAAFCSVDGQALQTVISPPPPIQSLMGGQQKINDSEHIRILAIFHFIVAGLAFCGIGFLFLHYLILNHMFLNPAFIKSPPGQPLPKDFFKFFIWIYVLLGVIFACLGMLNFLSALFLLRRKGRTFSLVVGALNCLQIPFGTILGVFTIIVLTRPSVREVYSR